MTRPSIAPDVAAALTAAIPARLVKKLDAAPDLAARWTWTDTTITTDKGEVVTLAVSDGIATSVTCSCLLGPKCLHVAAVVAVLDPAEGAAPAPVEAAVAVITIETSASAPQVARDAFRITADVLATGAETTGAFVQAELLRSIHACRTHGLYRLATTQTRILRSVRELRADRPEFELDVLTADLRDALDVAHALSSGSGGATTALVGTARREYTAIGSLRLRGVLTEAVVARSGYAGAVTYLADDHARLYTRSDIAPGDAGRAAGAYDAPANIGDAVLPHRELCRTGLFLSEATASSDGRLGAGQGVRAVRASEPSTWDHEALAPRWATSLADQLAVIAAHDAATEAVRPAGWDLVFVAGTLLGGGPHGVGLVVDDLPIRLVTAHDQRVLAARDNLSILARSPGLAIRAIGRVRLGVPRQLELLALAPAPGELRLPMISAWHGRANLHYDRLSLPVLGDARPILAAMPAPTDDLLAPLRRRVERVAQGGLGTLPTHALAELEREATAMTERSLRGGADVLRDLAAIAHDATRAMAGVRRSIDRATFARAWLRAAIYEDAARRRLSVASW